mmetsp:Transcript_13625/g.31939  ORF Transcript_13625/g.31939 Transcript_13625/m.31939 type:complete len:298 (-) Transcript_13625:340-1233(-)
MGRIRTRGRCCDGHEAGDHEGRGHQQPRVVGNLLEPVRSARLDDHGREDVGQEDETDGVLADRLRGGDHDDVSDVVDDSGDPEVHPEAPSDLETPLPNEGSLLRTTTTMPPLVVQDFVLVEEFVLVIAAVIHVTVASVVADVASSGTIGFRRKRKILRQLDRYLRGRRRVALLGVLLQLHLLLYILSTDDRFVPTDRRPLDLPNQKARNPGGICVCASESSRVESSFTPLSRFAISMTTTTEAAGRFRNPIARPPVKRVGRPDRSIHSFVRSFSACTSLLTTLWEPPRPLRRRSCSC